MHRNTAIFAGSRSPNPRSMVTVFNFLQSAPVPVFPLDLPIPICPESMWMWLRIHPPLRFLPEHYPELCADIFGTKADYSPSVVALKDFSSKPVLYAPSDMNFAISERDGVLVVGLFPLFSRLVMNVFPSRRWEASVPLAVPPVPSAVHNAATTDTLRRYKEAPTGKMEGCLFHLLN